MALSSLQDLLLQTPLSQLNSVLSDLRGLLSPCNAQATGASPNLAKEFEACLPSLLERFYEEQGKVVRLPGMEGGSIVAKEAKECVEGSSSTYRDEAKAKRFRLDALSGAVASADSYTVRSKDELRMELERALQGYLREHYPDLDKTRTMEGACGAVWRGPLKEVKVLSPAVAEHQQGEQEDELMRNSPSVDTSVQPRSDDESAKVFEAVGTVSEAAPVPDAGASADTDTSSQATPHLTDNEAESELVESESGAAERYTIRIVSGQSNSANFWSGRLVSTYVFHPASSLLTASLKFQIHYYENGNVQLNTSASSTELSLPASFATTSMASQQARLIIQTIKKYETEYQLGIEEAYEGLNERAFKNLRRQLPVTRQKVDWDKVLNYRLGSDLAGAQQAR